jgi:hypothetical protein
MQVGNARLWLLICMTGMPNCKLVLCMLGTQWARKMPRLATCGSFVACSWRQPSQRAATTAAASPGLRGTFSHAAC